MTTRIQVKLNSIACYWERAIYHIYICYLEINEISLQLKRLHVNVLLGKEFYISPSIIIIDLILSF